MTWKMLRSLGLLISFLPAPRLCAANTDELKERRGRAAKAFSNGVLLLHSKTYADFLGDGYREDAAFYYLTGLENSPGAILAVVGKSAESWLFVPPSDPMRASEIRPGDEAARKLGLDHVVDWEELEPFVSSQVKAGARIFYKPETPMLPDKLAAAQDLRTPAWIQVLQRDFPGADFQSVGLRLYTLMAIAAFNAGLHAIGPRVSQREVELAVVAACWKGARGVSFWPWAMAGENSVFPKPFESDSRYDHLDSVMKPGDLVRLDVGCEWNIFVAAYQAVAHELKEGLTDERAFDIWRTELLSHRGSAKTPLAQDAIAQWSDRKNVSYWQMHTMNLDAGYIEGPLRAGMVIDFEPIAAIAGQGYYLDDMYLIGKESSEILTPRVPYTADEIEKQMADKP